MANSLEEYLSEIRDLRGVATKETSGYPALDKLLYEAGTTLKPMVRWSCFRIGRRDGENPVFKRLELTCADEMF